MVNKKDVNEKVDDIKSSASDKKEDVSNRINEISEDSKEKSDKLQRDTKHKVDDIKSSASDMKDDVSNKINEIKEDTQDKTEDLQEEVEKKKNQTENLLNDIMNTIKSKQSEVGKTLSDYKSSPKPSLDVIETTENIILKIDIPGVKKEDIDIGIAGERIDIMVKFEEEMEGEDVNFIQKERSYGETKRTIKLPSEIKVKEASANFIDSVLTIKLPKIQQEVHKININ
ncbi:MAG: Hsp20/alpha crystallin family protein [Methanobacteriaceae archaeon]|nr:Hsp20/alpha crystallin family protein [Methanobacteriaceae archaeon]MDO9626017.1 Hsp20/alpha crystallin family protein [Methanobacteriaceae archaeon]